ncbi:hypothetical protein D3C74_442520 [compost metagenome]
MFLRHKSFGECRTQIQGILDTISGHSTTAEYEDQWINVVYTASFGLYYYQAAPGQQTSMEKAYVYADQLLLESKKLGRNRLRYTNELEV